MLSSHEAYGITVAEALAAGTPCVVAKGSALEEFIDGIQCFGVDQPDKRENLIKLINQVKDLKFNRKLNIKNLAIYDWDQVTKKIEKIYSAK